MLRQVLVAGWLAMVIIAKSTPARADAAEVEALIAKGNELRRAGTPGPALPYFQKAYELARTPRTTGQLGLAELAAGYPVEAEAHLSMALQTPDDPSIVKYQQILADALTLARHQIGELSIEGSPAGADVIVNGRSVGALPLPIAIKLPARNAEIIVRASGYSERHEMMPIAGGQRHSLTVRLLPIAKPVEPEPTVVVAPPAPPAAAPPVPAPAAPAPTVVEARAAAPTASGSGMRTAAWVTGGGAVVALGGGVALHFAARTNSARFNASCATQPHPLETESCRDTNDAWQFDKLFSLVGYAAGGALAVTSAVLFWTSRPAPSHASAQAHFRCAPTPTGVGCAGVF
jgi:hypothetical protein